MPTFITYVPTPYEDIDYFFDLVPLFPSDVVYDLGSGDGRLLFAAIDKGAGKAVGIEINPLCIQKSREMAKNKGLENKITFLEADFMKVDLSRATVVFCYLFSAVSRVLKPKFESELKPGTRVVMEGFPMPGWKPVLTTPRGRKQFYLYHMPSEIVVEDIIVA